MSQAEFGAALGVSRGVVAQIERGRSGPAAGLAERAAALAATESRGATGEGTDRDAAAGRAGAVDPWPGSADVSPAAEEGRVGEDTGNVMSRLHEAVTRLARAVELNTRHAQLRQERTPTRRKGSPARVAAFAAMAYGAAGAFMLTGLLVRHGPQPVLTLMADFATAAGRWLLDLVPFV